MVNRAVCQWFTEFYHVTLRNADGTPVRCRANGACKTWKREPARFRLPVKYGIRSYFYLTPDNASKWVPSAVWTWCEKYEMDPATTPLEILADKIEENARGPVQVKIAQNYRELAFDRTPVPTTHVAETAGV